MNGVFLDNYGGVIKYQPGIINPMEKYTLEQFYHLKKQNENLKKMFWILDFPVAYDRWLFGPKKEKNFLHHHLTATQ